MLLLLFGQNNGAHTNKTILHHEERLRHRGLPARNGGSGSCLIMLALPPALPPVFRRFTRGNDALKALCPACTSLDNALLPPDNLYR